jgi:putative ABC transport system permease protein
MRGPLLLARRPGVALALAAASLVATLPAAAAAPFLSSARSATLHRQIDRTCQYHLGVTVTQQRAYAWNPGYEGDAEPPNVGAVEGLTPPVSTMSVDLVGNTSTRPDIPTPLTLLARTGFTEQVTALEGPSGSGVWLPNEYAEANRLKVGDTITLSRSGASVQPASVRVAAIYTDLRREPTTPYWCSYETTYRGKPSAELEDPPPPMVLMDWKTLHDLSTQLGLTVTVTVEYAVVGADRLTHPEAERLGQRIAELRTVATSMGHFGSFRSALGRQAARAEFVRRGMVTAVIPITAVGVLVGLLVVAASAVFWVQRRRQELTVLAAHGVGPPALGGKAVMEALPALVVGALGGWAGAWLLVRVAGPSPILSPDAPRLALLAAAATLIAATAVVGVTAAIRSRTLTDQSGRRRRRLLAWPWELLLLASAYPVWLLLGGRTETMDTSLGAVAQVPARLLVVPIMVAIGVVTLLARLVRRAIKRPKTWKSLARSRLAREPGAPVLLAGAVAIPIALAAYGAVVTSSVETTLRAEARYIVGADVVLTLARPAPIPDALRGRATVVLRLDGTIIDGIETDILGVDPATFDRGAFHDSGPGAVSLPDLLHDLRAGDPVHGFGSGVAPIGTHPVEWRGTPLLTADIERVTRLPAQRSSYPVLLVHRDDLAAMAQQIGANPVVQLWVRGDSAEVARITRDAGLPLSRMLDADAIFTDTIYEPVTYTFAYLSALALLTGLVTTVGLLLYLESRAPAHRRSYVLLRRMGLRRRSHLWSLAVELGLALFGGLVAGLAIAAGLAAALTGAFDINPGLVPETVLAIPVGTIVTIVATVALVAVASTLYAQLRVTRARPGEVLRDAE